MWTGFLRRLNIHYDNLSYTVKSPHFFISLQSVKAGLGLGLLPEFLIRNDLAAGNIVHVLNIDTASNFGYFVLAPSYKKKLAKVRLFKNWLQQQLLSAD